MENNNTKDVAYLGLYPSMSEHPEQCVIDIVVKYSIGVPVWGSICVTDLLLFDCNGTRYGFRIKTLKTK